LASSLADEVGPRLAGSPGDAAAVQWAERTMRALKLANVHLEPVTVPVWKRGEERARIVAAGDDGRALDVNALGWSGSTPAEGVEADVVRAATVDDLAKLPDDALRGKIAFVDAPMKRTADGSGYGQAVSRRYRAQTVAGKKGAVAVLIRSVGTDEHHPHTGSTNRGDAPGIPIGALSNDSANVLARATATGPVRMRLVLASQRLPDAPSSNVVGEIVGREKPDEVVLLGAHLDSWDTGRGALDDGAGCGVVLDAIRLLATEKPSRTVRVVLFAAEENSRAGGTQYAKAHADELEKIVLSIEVDSGSDRVMSLGFLGDPEKAAPLRSIAEPLGPLGIHFTDGKSHAGADVEPLVARGVPSIDLRQDVSRYFDNHHTRGDTPDKLDAEGLAQVTAAVAHVASRVAGDAGLSFGRVPAKLRPED
jgi:Zn-dependent M28 family amino/carboxypeptidase